MKPASGYLRRIRSFVRRDGRMTDAQRRAVATLWERFGLELSEGRLDVARAFGREAPCFLEIGFGTGHSLLAAASQYPEVNFIGVETHLPGVGTLLQGIETEGVTNIRLYHADVIEVMAQCLPEACLAGIQIFFPDPWPKRRHHKRRLVQPGFVAECLLRLAEGGVLHLATDWEDYALHMMRVLSAVPQLENLAGEGQFATRSAHRPLATRFERRGEQAGHVIRELAFVKKELAQSSVILSSAEVAK